MPTPYPISYLDGSTLSSTALTAEQLDAIWQIAICQMLGITAFSTSMVLVLNSDVATPALMSHLEVGQLLTDTNIPQGTTILSIGATTITMSNPASSGSTDVVTVSDVNAPNQVRIGWQVQGQPGPGITPDSVALTCEPLDTPYSRLRDSVFSTSGITDNQTDVFTRTWRLRLYFYGTDCLNDAKAVQSGLIMVPQIANLLAVSNLYVNPDIEEPSRFRDNFQGQWWERADMTVEFNEQITEVLSVGTVNSVEVKIYDHSGQIDDFTVTAP